MENAGRPNYNHTFYEARGPHDWMEMKDVSIRIAVFYAPPQGRAVR